MAKPEPLNIVFAMLSEAGHYTGTFRLARSLRDRGHHVVYLGIADLEPLVTSQGFDFVPFAADLLPAGSLNRYAATLGAATRGLRSRWRKRRADEWLFSEYLGRIADGPLDECLRSQRPHLLLCDTFVWYMALRALRLGIPVIDISIILSLHRNSRLPPIISSHTPSDTRWSTLAVRASWALMRCKFFFSKRLASRIFGSFRFPTRMHHLTNVFLHLARRSGYPCRENETWCFGETGPRLALPEIVLCPEAFQLPGKPQDGRRYLGDFVDLERCEEPLPAAIATADQPLVYCSLGSSPVFYPHAPRFFAAVVGASRLRRDWQFVLHIGNHPTPQAPAPGEPNLLVRRQVPQLALLRAASVMVTHGGLNSIMECIQFGVPMVIVPGLRDQPGNAVRAVHHNLAVTAKMATLSPGSLVSLVARAMESPHLHAGLAAMKRNVEAEKGLESAVAFIERSARPTGIL